MSEHAAPTGGEGVETRDISHKAVVVFIVLFTLAVFAGFLSMNYLWRFLVNLEMERRVAADPVATEQKAREFEAQKKLLFDRFVPVAKRGYEGEKKANDPDWLEYHVAVDRIQVHGIPRAALPPEPTLESADLLDPRHSGAVRSPVSLGQDNIVEGEMILDPKGKTELLEKLKADKKLTMPESMKLILEKKLLKTAPTK